MTTVQTDAGGKWVENGFSTKQKATSSLKCYRVPFPPLGRTERLEADIFAFTC